MFDKAKEKAAVHATYVKARAHLEEYQETYVAAGVAATVGIGLGMFLGITVARPKIDVTLVVTNN